IRFFDQIGGYRGKVPLGPFSSVDEIVRVGEGEDILFRTNSFVEPSAWHYFDSLTGKAWRTALYHTSPAGFSDCIVDQKFATSKDGTKVPLHVLRLKTSRLDGNNPTLLYGYGGYGISMKPHFQADLRVWLEQGGVYAVASIRGGGEYG